MNARPSSPQSATLFQSGLLSVPCMTVSVHFQDGEDCSCQAGLTCKLTKQIIKMGEVMPVKQCVPEGDAIDVETVDLDEESADTPLERNKRWLWFNVRIICVYFTSFCLSLSISLKYLAGENLNASGRLTKLLRSTIAKNGLCQQVLVTL